VSDDLTAILAGIRADAEGFIIDSDEDCAEVRVSCLGHNALRLLSAVDAVLALTRDSTGNDRHRERVLTVGDVREAITRELTGGAGDGS